MKVLACSDVHASAKAMKELQKKAKFVDLIICCGDFTVFGNGILQLLKMFQSFPKQVLLIQGNHEDHLDLEKICKAFPNILYLHNKAIIIDNYFFFGNSGNGFTHVDEIFEQEIKKVIPYLKKYKDYKKVLLTHAPPYGTKADLIIDRHCGNKSIKNFIIEQKIDFHFCGHIHEGAKTITEVHKTKVINSGPYGMIVNI